MKRLIAVLICALAGSVLQGEPSNAQPSAPAAAHQNQYRNFHVAIYVTVDMTHRLADPAEFAREFDRVWRQVHFDKVFIEGYRSRRFATDQEIDAVAAAFRAHGVQTDGGVTLDAGASGGQFETFDYENPADVAQCQQAVTLMARHFDHVILDDFFFYNTKSERDIAAQGNRTWTQYRLDTMRRMSRECVLDPARRANPNVRVTIKYPNWYEHFQGSGFDLDQQAHLFDGIYTGTETRDPHVTDQLLQQYESYEVFRYFSNVRPNGGDLGGWVDTFDSLYVDRYAEQLWLTLLAKAPEITLFSWAAMASAAPLAPGERPWSAAPSSFDWSAMAHSYRPGGGGDPGPGWARAAGYALEQIDPVIGALGKPIGIASYRPPGATGEDFIHNYLGNIGIPIELSPAFPVGAHTVLLTQGAAADPHIVDEIRTQLLSGGNVVITSGLLRVLQDRGFDRVDEVSTTGSVAAINRFIDGYGAGAGQSLNTPGGGDAPVLFPEIRFNTNDSWPIIRGVANARGFPVMLMNRYGRGVLYVLAIPDNISDLYALPQPLLDRIRHYVQGDFPVRLRAPALVSLFAYDNGAFVVHSFRDTPTDVRVEVTGAGASLTNVVTSAQVTAEPPEPVPPNWRSLPETPRSTFAIHLQPHSYAAFRVVRTSPEHH